MLHAGVAAVHDGPTQFPFDRHRVRVHRHVEHPLRRAEHQLHHGELDEPGCQPHADERDRQ